MMKHFKKLNYWHIALIVMLPIVLALVNPNWIFNVNIVDDYAYLGFQMDYPKYIGWSPAEESYAIERLSALMPGYVVRQIFSPMVANFILHLGVYYVTVFSVYGVLNLLTNSKVALITVLLFGQHPIILRSLGWDYVDGYALAYFILIIFFLTQSVGSARRRLYLIMAGASFILMINANFFNLFYFPAILAYYLLINQWRNIAHTLISPMLWGGVGAIVMYVGLAGLYYALTGNLLFDNSIGTYDLKFYKFFLQNNFSKTPAHWHFLFVMTALIVIGRPLLWRKLTFIDADKPQYKNMRVILRAVFGLFVFSFGMIGVWQFYGFFGSF
nr:hypothetical protein [Anaerolineae bacterium]